jgi:hypothetical protein
MAGLLWLTAFFNVEELQALNALRQRRPEPSPAAPRSETIEMAGEIVTVDLRSDDAIVPPTPREQPR